MSKNGVRWFATWMALASLMACPTGLAAERSVDAARQLQSQALDFYKSGRYVEGLPIAQQAAGMLEALVGSEHPDSVAALLNLADLQRAGGNFTAAEPLYQRVLDLQLRTNRGEDSTTAAALQGLAAAYSETNAYAAAEPLYRRLVTMRERIDGLQGPGTAKSINDLGRVYHAMGAYEKALPLYQRALVIQEKTSPEHPDTLATLSNLANLQMDLGDYAQSEALHLRALKSRERSLGAEHIDTAASLANLGNLYRRAGDYPRAEAQLRRAVAIFSKVLGPEHPKTAKALLGLGDLYRFMGEYAKAEPPLQRSLQIREKVQGLQHLDTAASSGALAALYFATGAYDKAALLFKRALRIRESLLGAEHPDVATVLNDLGRLNSFAGNFAESEASYLRAAAILTKAFGSDHPETVSTQVNLGNLYTAAGEYTKAERLFKQQLTVIEPRLGPEHPIIAVTLVNLGIVYREIGAYDAAAPLLERAAAMSRNLLGPEHDETAAALAELAALRYLQGDFSNAQQLYENVLAIQEKALGAEHPDRAFAMGELATVHRAMGAYGKSRTLYNRAATMQGRSLGSEHGNVTFARIRLALLSWTLGRPLEAVPSLRNIQAIVERQRVSQLRYSSQSRNQAYLQRSFEQELKNAALSLAVALESPEAIELGLTTALQYKGRVQDAASASVERLRQSLRVEDRVLFTKLAEVANRLSALTYQGATDLSRPSIDRHLQQLRELAEQQESLESELAQRSSEFGREVASVTVRSVRQAIPRDAALLEWIQYVPYDARVSDLRSAWGPPRYAVYILKAAGAAHVIDLGEARDIELAAQAFRSAVSTRSSTDFMQRAATLSDKIIAPLRPHLSGVRHLLMSTDGVLNLVPIGALLDEHGSYLLDRFEISYLTSGRDLLRFLHAGPRLSSNIVVIGNPDYDEQTPLAYRDGAASEPQRSADLDRDGLSFRSLPGTALEADAIADLLRNEGVRVLTQSQASETRLKQVHGPRILHLATHGFFLDDQTPWPKTTVTAVPGIESFSNENSMLRSGLALAGANRRRSGFVDDGILTALEASRLDLRGTELVVLSACDTGIGEIRNGEGVGGLRRALLLAGARSQVATLWKVADLRTKDMMVSFYHNLVAGEGRAEALRHAQQSIQRSTRPHPYYWAGFVSIGDWSALYRR